MSYPSDSHLPASSSALTAFLHGIEPRAWVFALSQCGLAERANDALESTLRDFLARTPALPLAQWPMQFWTSLLQQPVMLVEIDRGRDWSEFPPGPRAALLLRLIAGLDVGHAAQALGVSPAAYTEALRSALDRPGLDEVRIQALREQLHEQIQQLPVARRETLAALREKALLPGSDGEPRRLPSEGRPAPQRWWWWGALAGLLLAFIATFLWPVDALLPRGQGRSLPEEAIGPLPTLTDTVIITLPDYEQLAEPADEAIAQQLAVFSWVDADSPSVATLDPPPVQAPPPASFDALAVAERGLLASARAAWPTLDPGIRAELLRHARDWQSRTAEQRARLRQRVRQWDRQPARARALRRAPFLAWQALSPAERQRVRSAASTVAALSPAEQQALRERFAALPADTQRLWWLGPALGQEVAPIASLFAFMPEADRPALLVALRSLDAQVRDDLAVLAPQLSEAQRQSLRKDLLAAPPAQRAGLIRQRLAQ